MTVILMLAMFAIFLTIDYLRKGREAAQTAEARQEAAERLAPAGGGDQQGVPARQAGFEHLELMAARAPGARSEPRLEARRQDGRGEVERGHGRGL